MRSRTCSSVMGPPGRYQRPTLTIRAEYARAQQLVRHGAGTRPGGHAPDQQVPSSPARERAGPAGGPRRRSASSRLDLREAGEQIHVVVQDAHLQNLVVGDVVRRAYGRPKGLDRVRGVRGRLRELVVGTLSSSRMMVSRQ